ncbi:hypothetical protein BJX61DRAFT_551484 [Aspergillus egyptiacus]|nr:hypothetical protein BJX61DRAFT_551484 [Aspergillus egyptiacus]
MVRLTYSARKITGVKVGQVVSKDLRKRIPPGLGSKAAARDPTIEIDLTGKCLTDEGFAQFIDDLITCVQFRGADHPVGVAKVTEFHLQGNNLTVQSLAKLGEVIPHINGDLRELNLSQNEIRVQTAEEKKIWRVFLQAFKNCYMLKKLDLSGNPLGPAGLEVLACVYTKSDLDFVEDDAIDFVAAHGADEEALAGEVGALNIDGKENESPRAARSKKSPNKGGKPVKQNGASTAAVPSKSFTVVDLKKYACTRGLRSIPYLIISDIAITNISAIHLSHMLATQRASEYLLTYLPPGKASAIPEFAKSATSVICNPNDTLQPFAKRLLEVTEEYAQFNAKAQADSDDENSDDEDKKREVQRKLGLEFTRLTKRVRIESLKQEGVHATDIGFIALKMLVMARALLLEDRDRPVEEPVEEPDEDEAEAERTEGSEIEQEAEPEPQVDASPTTFFDVPRYTFADTFTLGPFHPEAARFAELFPSLPPVQEKAIVQEKQTPEAEPKPSPETSPSQSVRPSGKGSSRAQKAHKSEWRFGLPFEIWRRIIADAVGANGILDHDQQARILHYASDWRAVAYELTIKGAEDHQQIWKFLETVGCFTYTPY